MPKTILYMVRHGRAMGNRRHILNGCRLDVPLTKFGYAQAKAFAREWKIRPDAVIASPLKRAMSTARVFAKKFRLPIAKEPLIVEQDCGGWTGKNYYHLMVSHPQNFFYDGGKTSTYLVRVPGGESWRAICRRARRFLALVGKKYAGKTVVAFSHGVFMHACVSVHRKIRAPQVYRVEIRNTHSRKFDL